MAAQAQSVSFIARLDFETGGRPQSVAVGDFNGDGVLDLATNVSVLLGNGDGSFQPAQSFDGGISVAVGDFNGDGALDLVVANARSNNVSVLLGNGDGSFQPARHFSVGSSPSSVAVGDFNGDGVPDLAVTNSGSYPYQRDGSISILLGTGDGGFISAPTIPAGDTPAAVAIADFNGDGTSDLVIVNNGYFVDDGGDYIFVPGFTSRLFLGNGDGTFQSGAVLLVEASPSSVAVGDFNGDGVPDLAVANAGSSAYHRDGSISVLLGTGDGGFTAARTIAAGDSPAAIAIADFNGDGTSDLVVVNYGYWVPDPYGYGGLVFVPDTTSRLFLGNGDGTFRSGVVLEVGGAPIFVAVGDFNSDGMPDLAVANSYSKNISVLLGNGDGSFEEARSFAAAGAPTSMAVGDFNGDGVPDLAVASHDSNSVSVLLGNGDGSFQPARSYAAGSTPTSVAVGDFNGDGIPDLVVANYLSESVSVLLGNGDGSFQPARSFFARIGPSSVAVGDFNGDGIPDLAVTNYLSDAVSVLLGNGDGTFQTAVRYVTDLNPYSVAVGDFNGDGVQDLAVANSVPNNVSVLLGNGDGTFRAALNYPAGSGPYFVAVGDFNGDGVPDLAVANHSSDTVSVLLGNGDGSFQPAHSFGGGRGPLSVAVGDFNGDGVQDLAVAGHLVNPFDGSFFNDVSVLLGNGDGSFQRARSFGAGNYADFVAVGDFNGDGLLDLAVANANSLAVSVLINNTRH
jgi:hypothetical protein